MNHLFKVLFIITLAHAVWAQPASEMTAEFIYRPSDVDFPACHASTIVEVTPGHLLAAWFGGTHERHEDVCIYAAHKINGRWSNPVKVADGAEDGTKYPCWNPVLCQVTPGFMVLYYKVGPNPRSWWGMYKTSHDHGQTWSPGIKIPDGLLGPIKNKPFRLDNGHLLYPSSFETGKVWNVYLETSDQNLGNWKKISLDNQKLQSIQPAVLNHGGGKLQLLCRSQNNCITTCWSADGGITWGKVTKTNLPNNNAGIDAITLADGRFLLVHTPLTKGRHQLVVSSSTDGVQWKEVIVLENDQPGTEYSYPAIIQGVDGKIHVTYTWRRERIKYVTFDPNNL